MFLILFSSGSAVSGQNVPDQLTNNQLQIQKASSTILLDGIIDEQAWNEADVASNFWMQYPIDNVKADARTEVRVTYDSENVYISAV